MLATDATDSTLASDPTDSTLASEPAEPMDKIDPLEPIDKIEPVEPIDKIEALEPIDKIDSDEPAERDEPPLIAMGPFCRHWWPRRCSTRCAAESSTRWTAGSTGLAFTARLRQTVDLDAVRGDLMGAVDAAFQPAHVSVWLPGNAEVSRPLTLADRPAGMQ